METKRLWYADEMPKIWLDYQHLRAEQPHLFALKSTGLKVLDYILGGGIELIQYGLIGGAQKSGKTTLLMKIADAFGRQRVNSAIFSAEMTNMQLGTILFSTYSGVDRTKIRAADLEIYDWKKLEKAGEEIAKLTLAFDYGFSRVSDIPPILDEIEAKTAPLELGPVRAIFGDYIHLMEGEKGFRGSRQEEIAHISRNLKLYSIKREMPMAVIFAAQLSREAVRANIIEATSFLGSGQLERDMDFGLIISDVKDELSKDRRALPNVKKITIVGSRETDLGDCEVAYDGTTATIRDKTVITTTTTINFWET